MFDTGQLAPTSSKERLRWRDPRLTFIWLRADGRVVVASTTADKLNAVRSCGLDDCVLAARQVQFPHRVDVMVVDDLAKARRALAGED